MGSEGIQKIIRFVFSNIIDKIFRTIGAGITGTGTWILHYFSRAENQIKFPAQPTQTDYRQLWWQLGWFISQKMFYSACLGLVFALLIVFWLAIRGPNPFISLGAGQIRRFSRWGCIVCLGFVAAFYTVLLLNEDMYKVFFHDGIIADLSPEGFRVLASMGAGLVACCVVGYATLGGLLFAAAPADVRVLAAPLGLGRLFRSILLLT